MDRPQLEGLEYFFCEKEQHRRQIDVFTLVTPGFDERLIFELEELNLKVKMCQRSHDLNIV